MQGRIQPTYTYFARVKCLCMYLPVLPAYHYWALQYVCVTVEEDSIWEAADFFFPPCRGAGAIIFFFFSSCILLDVRGADRPTNHCPEKVRPKIEEREKNPPRHSISREIMRNGKRGKGTNVKTTRLCSFGPPPAPPPAPTLPPLRFLVRK